MGANISPFVLEQIQKHRLLCLQNEHQSGATQTTSLLEGSTGSTKENTAQTLRKI